MNVINPLDPAKFKDPQKTAGGDDRASVALQRLRTLWVNTGTLCNIECANCYIESSPKNDRLVYLTAAELRLYLHEIEREWLGTEEIAFTGGEPFMNPDMIAMLEDVLAKGFRALVLTNAMKPMQNKQQAILGLHKWFGESLKLRVSIDHYDPAKHEAERGAGSWEPMIAGLKFLSENGITLDIAGRTPWGEEESDLRDGYAALFAEHDISVDAHDPVALTLFPEMDEKIDVPEITTDCWGILNVSPDDMMCASSRMLIKRKGAEAPSVVACTLLPYDEQFELGNSLAESLRPVPLNHPHCAQFCVLGGGACSAG